MTLRFLRQQLDELEARDLLRSPRKELAPDTIVLCSNDYLGYAQRPVRHAVPLPGGAGASRLISGEHAAHRALERTLAGWVGHEAALLFSSGYAANCGLLSALAMRGDVIVSDRLNHASIIDGCRLSDADVVVVDHCDSRAVENALKHTSSARRRFVVTESYFSMDGHSPDGAKLTALCDAHDATLIVDEAHALGVFGEAGQGLCPTADVLVGTLGKAVGLQGAFVAGSNELIHWLYNRARSFVFSTATSPWLAPVVEQRVREVRQDDAARARLAIIGDRFRAALPGAAPSHGPIIPLLVGDPGATVRKSEALLSDGLFVQAIRPPTVPEGTSRLRISLSAALSDEDVTRALAVLARHVDVA